MVMLWPPRAVQASHHRSEGSVSSRTRAPEAWGISAGSPRVAAVSTAVRLKG